MKKFKSIYQHIEDLEKRVTFVLLCYLILLTSLITFTLFSTKTLNNRVNQIETQLHSHEKQTFQPPAPPTTRISKVR